jgi:hypothetical protein
VWHLHQNPTSAILDATNNGNSGTSQGGMTASSSVESVIGKGLSFDGTNDYCNLTNNASLQITGEVTISAWVKSKANNAFFGIGGKTCVTPFKGFGIHKFNTNYFQFQAGNGTIDEKLPSNAAYTDTNWHYVAGVRRGGINYLFMDGIQQSATGSLSFTDNGSYAFVGKHYANFDGRYWNGAIDEMCISRKGRSADWVKLCYENQKTNQTLVKVIRDIEDYTQWPSSQRIYFNTTASGAAVTADVYNFPFLVRLNTGNFDFSQTSSDGRSLRFSDPDGTHLPYEIASWDATRMLASIWVKVPRIDGNSTTDYIVMHYGKYAQTDMQDNFGVWDSTFAGVWHLDETPPDIVRDATINGNNGASNGAMTATSAVPAVLGRGFNFDGIDDWISVPSSSSFNIASGVTVSAWFKADALTAYARIAAKSHTFDATPFTMYGMALDNAGHLRGEIADGGSQYAVNGSTTLNTTGYFFGTFTYDGSALKLYVNGKKENNTTSHTGGITVNAQVFSIGRSGYNNNRFDGIIDEVQVSNKARDSNWVKLSYQNQRTDSMKLQVIPVTSLAAVFDGSIMNKPSDFDKGGITMKIMHKGDNPKIDSLSHVLVRFDTRGLAKRQDQGWVLDDVKFQLGIDSISTPFYRDSTSIGIVSGDRMMSATRRDGYQAWREDRRSSCDSVISMSGSKYSRGISGQPDSSGEWAWVLYDFQSEIKRLDFVAIDSICWYAGTQDGGGNVKTFVKTSDSAQSPSDSLWEAGGLGIISVQTTDGQKNQYYALKTGFSTLRWLWLATRRTGTDTTACAVWGDFKIFGKRHKNAEVLFYQVKDDGIDTAYLSFSNRGNGLAWRHAAFEQDAGTDSCEGIGTEDFIKIVPGHDPLWNRYNAKYRSRSPVGSVIIPGSYTTSTLDSVRTYFGIESPDRFQPAGMVNGYFRFREDRRADNLASLRLNRTVYSTGVGGSAGGSGNYSYLLYNMQSEAARLGFGKLYAIRGMAGYCAGSDSVQVFVKTCTTTVQPTLANWINNNGGVIQRVSHTSWSGTYYTSVNLTNDGYGGPASNIKWVWLSVYSTKGDGSTSFGAFPGLEIVAQHKFTHTLSLQNSMLLQSVQKALLDTANPYITLLGVTKDVAATISFITSRSPRTTLRPKLDLHFSDSKTLLSWQGRNDSLTIPKSEFMSLAGTPSIGDGRFDRVLRFHAANTQYVQITDTCHIDYLQGILTFCYQMDMNGVSDSGVGAEFFSRTGSAATQFKLCRDGDRLGLLFCFGDTTGDSTGPNRTVFSCIDSSTTPLDTIVNPFDGNQHYFKFAWDRFTQTASLTIDGKALPIKKSALFNSNPQSWAKANIRFGRNIDGYIEDLVVRSRMFEPKEVTIARPNIEAMGGYLPFIQPGFNDTVDCIVICPEEGFFRQECDRYALRNLSLGVRTAVVSLAEINKFYSGSDEQDRIRNFLKRAYLSWRSKYLVLAGCTDLIPSRKVAFQSKNGHAVTTDRYYACLEGTWNEDGDKYFSEFEDSTDMTAELIVARFPAATWSELHTMIEKSSMGFGLPPYKEQCTGNTDTVMFTGIRMADSIGNISDGQYYCNNLMSIFNKGAYTSALQLRTYFPNDDPSHHDTDAVQRRLNEFVDSLDGFPHLWIHYGHGSYGSATIDRVGDNFVMLENSLLKDRSVFNRFKRLGHVRIVGCEAASQDLNSIARTFLAKPYGGALTYIGTSEYSYSEIETPLLMEECRNIADSSLFVWGDVFAKSAEIVFKNSGRINNNAKWVIMSRNFMGDPLLPVRHGALAFNDTLKIAMSGNIKRGANSIAVTVTDKNNNPVEGAFVGIVPLSVSRIINDTLANMGKTQADATFGRCVTNRKGKGTLAFTLLKSDSLLCVTATHPDFLCTRKIAGAVDSVSGAITAYLRSFSDVDSIHPHGNFNGNAEAGETITLQYTVLKKQQFNTASVSFDTASTGTRLTLENVSFSAISDTSVYTLAIRFALRSCPAGTGQLAMHAYFFRSGVKKDSIQITVPITGPDIVPVITYLPDGGGDYTPENGDNIRMRILLGNRTIAEACSVKCRLVESSPFITVIRDSTAKIREVRADSSAFDDNIEYSVTGGYTEDANGIIPAKLIITANNMSSDTVAIDLNPLSGTDLHVAGEMTELDYRQGVRVEWNPIKVDSVHGQHSDFLGYVVMRKAYHDTADNYTLLTPWAVTSTNYYYDRLPDTSANEFTYRIAAVDSSYNCSSEDTVDVVRPPYVKRSFPIRTAALMKAPSMGNYGKAGIADVYTVAGATAGNVAAFRGNGEEAIVSGVNDGVFANVKALQTISVDINNDGLDDAILITADSVIGWNSNTNARAWAHFLSDAPHVGSIICERKPVVADLDKDGTPEIILYCHDNKGNGATTLDIFSPSGAHLARRTFADCTYPIAISAGDFVTGGGHNGLEIAFITIPYVSVTDWKYYVYVLEYSPGTIAIIDSKYICHAQEGVVAGDSLRRIPYSGISAADLDVDGNTELVFCTGGFPEHSTTSGDSLFVFRINSSSGTLSRVDARRVDFMMAAIFGTSPVLADIDCNGTPDIVLAADDSMYVFKLQSGMLSQIVPVIPFGSKPANRLSRNCFTPQALVATIGAGPEKRIYVNHQGDGCIWAFDIGYSGSVWQAKRTPGYPLKAHGRVSEACAITDLEGDDTLDLTAVDDAGYIYAWKIGLGSIDKQPWPVQYGNNWNTASVGYKDAGVVGYFEEKWVTDREKPYRWVETEAGNSRTEISGTPVFIRDAGVYKTQAAADRNSHFSGPGTAGFRNYTIEGTVKFDDASAEFGVNFYSQWFSSPRKYTLMRRASGSVHMLCYWTETTGWDMGRVNYLDTVVAGLTGTWYHYEIKVENATNSISVKWWKEGDAKPGNEGLLAYFDYMTPPQGLVGVTTHTGSGYRYWGPIRVTSSDQAIGVKIAEENFTEDSIVEICPYTPRNWSPNCGSIKLATGYDTSGFAFNKQSISLAYKHQAGSQYPITCNIAPYSNLEWRDYELSGKIVKPAGVVYDSIWTGVDVYSTGKVQYRAKFRNDTMIVQGGGIAPTPVVLGSQFDNGDSLYFKVRIVTEDLKVGMVTYTDSVTSISIGVGINSSSTVPVFNVKDTLNHIKVGLPAIYLDLNGKENSAKNAIRIDDIIVQKVE